MNISENSVHENITKIKESLKEGIHFIGFDASHVGYVLKQDGELYLIHSNYFDYEGVVIENSEVFFSYNRFYLAEISTNKSILESWGNGNEVEIKQQN